MRNTRDLQRGAWATFAKNAREGAAVSQSELARRLGIDRVTVYRWETGKQRPENVAVVQAFARALNIPVEEALAAAGLLPSAKPPMEPTRDPDPELDRIRRSKLSNAAKARLIQRITERREREQQARLADLEDLIRAQERLER